MFDTLMSRSRQCNVLMINCTFFISTCGFQWCPNFVLRYRARERFFTFKSAVESMVLLSSSVSVSSPRMCVAIKVARRLAVNRASGYLG